MRRTRCTRLEIFLKNGYIYITDFVFQNLSKFGGGVNLTPLRFWPERSRMTPKWFKRTENKLFWRIKQFKVWFWGFWDDFWRSENFDLQYYNGPPLWWSKSKISDLQKSSQNTQKHTLNRIFRRNNLFSVNLNHSGAIPDLSDRNLRGRGQIDHPPNIAKFWKTKSFIYLTPFQFF